MRWNAAVKSILYVESVAVVGNAAVDSAVVHPFACASCPAAFASRKALGSHTRVKHKVLAPQRLHAGAECKCASCGTTFGSRLRLLAHPSDARRPMCWLAVQKLQPMGLDACAMLDAADTDSRRLAWRSGHTHAIAKGVAVRADGRGRVAQ